MAEGIVLERGNDTDLVYLRYAYLYDAWRHNVINAPWHHTRNTLDRPFNIKGGVYGVCVESFLQKL